MTGLGRQAATVALGRGFIRAAQFVTFLLLARMLSASEFGWFGLITTAFTLAATLGSLGLRQAFAYQIGQGRLHPGHAIGTALTLWPVLSVLAAALIFALYGFSLPGLSPTNSGLLILVGTSGVMAVTLMQGVYLGRGEIRAFTLSETLAPLLLTATICTFALLGWVSLGSALWAQTACVFVALPVVAWMAIRGSDRIRVRFDLLPSMLGYGLIFAINLFFVTLSSRASMFIIEARHGASAAGEYFAAVRLHEILLEVATALAMVVFSSATREKKDPSMLLRRNSRISALMLLSFITLGCLVALFAPVIVPLALGREYLAAVPALQILAISLGPMAAIKVIYSTIAGAGSPHFGTPLILVSLIANVGIAFLLTPLYGAVGGSAAMAVGQWVLFVSYVIAIRVKYKTPVHYFIVPAMTDIQAIWHALSRRARP